MRKILAAIDQSPWAQVVIKRAIETARFLNAELTLLTVVNSNPMMTTNISDETERLKGLHRKLVHDNFQPETVKTEVLPNKETFYKCGPRPELVIDSRIENGDPADRICKCADEINGDLVIVGSRGLTNIASFVLGSVSERIVHRSSHSVLVVKTPPPDNSQWEETSSRQKGSATREKTRETPESINTPFGT
jgi:nucleotide-binding universal stress UspA family protein